MSIEDRLRKSRIEAGYASGTETAKAFGWNVVTYRSHENGTRGIPRDKIESYARAFNVSIEWLLTGKGKKDGVGRVIPLRLLPVLGTVQGGAFLEAHTSFDEIFMPVAADPEYADYQQYLLEVSGPSMNLHYPEGSYVHCVHIEYHPDDVMPKHGDHVIVERRRGDLREVTIKEYILTNAGAELWPRSTEPKWKKPISLTDDLHVDEVMITALVIGSYTRRRR